MKNLAIIPARSGSKGLKNKNIKSLNGKPLIAYSIEAAIKSDQFHTVLVSTDSEMYADIAKAYKASVPFLRSKGLSNDTATIVDVVRDALQWYANKNIFFDTVTILQPTSPLRTACDITNGFKMMEKFMADVVVSVCEVDHSPLWTNTLPNDMSLKGFIDESYLNITRQKLPKYYQINGALYIVKSEYIMKETNFYTEKSYALIMDKRNSVDIDDELDFMFAEFLMSKL